MEARVCLAELTVLKRDQYELSASQVNVIASLRAVAFECLISLTNICEATRQWHVQAYRKTILHHTFREPNFP